MGSLEDGQRSVRHFGRRLHVRSTKSIWPGEGSNDGGVLEAC
jgi:hypothetical protein